MKAAKLTPKPSIQIRFIPDPPLKNQLLMLKKNPPLRQLEFVMKALANDTHRSEGLMPRWKRSQSAIRRGGITGRNTGTLMSGWRPKSTSGIARLVNPTSYAVDFYWGRPAGMKDVPAHQRKTKKGFVTVRAHTRRARAQVARPVNWTPKYIKKVEQVYLNAVK